MQPLLNDFILKIDDLWGTFIFCKIHNQGVIQKIFLRRSAVKTVIKHS